MTWAGAAAERDPAPHAPNRPGMEGGAVRITMIIMITITIMMIIILIMIIIIVLLVLLC